MKKHSNIRAALAAIAAIVGAGFASGREIMTFFSRFGMISYLGIATASVCGGLLAAMIMRFAKKRGSRTIPGIYTVEMGRVCGESVDALYGLMLLMTGAAMCAAGGELAALTLPIHFSRPFGVAATMLAALTAIYAGRRALAAMGAVIVPVVMVFYLALFFDHRPAVEPVLYKAGGVITSMPMAFIMGALYAAFNLSLAGGVLCLNCDEGTSPKKVGIMVGVFLLILLVPANAALLKAGPEFRSMELPSVVLAGKWGMFGFYACAGIFWFAVVSTLVAALAPLIRQIHDLPIAPLKKAGAPIAVCAMLLMSLIGYSSLVNAGYPLLGWACTFILLALLAFL